MSKQHISDSMTVKKGKTFCSINDSNEFINSQKQMSIVSLENSSLISEQNTTSTFQDSQNQLSGQCSRNFQQVSPHFSFSSPMMNGGDFIDKDGGELEQLSLNQRRTSIDQQLEQEFNQQRKKDYFQGQGCDQKIINFQQQFSQNQSAIEKALKKKNYYIKSYLDNGGEAIIFTGYKEYQNGAAKEQKDVALKVLLDVDEFPEETQILNAFESKINVIELIDTIEIKKKKIYIQVLEKCKYNMMHQLKLLQKLEEEFPLMLLLQMFFDLVDGLVQMRTYNVLHLDIKPNNILVSESNEYLYSDFGLSFKKKSNQKNNITLKGYTKSFASQEQILGGRVDFESDTYSLGRTFQVIIKAYCFANPGRDEKLIENLSKMVIEHMTQQNQYDRQNCIKLHEILFKSIDLQENREFFKNYSKKIKRIITLFPFDNNKDMPFFLDLQLYYCNVLLAIQKVILETTIHSDIAETLFQIGVCYNEKGKYQDALNFQFQGLEIRKQLYIGDNIQIASSLNNIGLNYYQLGDYQNALKYQLQTLEMRRNVYPGNHIDIAISLNSVGNSQADLGDLQSSLAYKLESLQMRKSLFQGDHPSVAIALNSVGIGYIKLGDPKHALEYQLGSLQMHRNLFKGNHPKISDSLNSVGHCYNLLKDLPNALKLTQESLEMRRQIFSENHPSIAQSLNVIGLVYLDLKQYKESIKYLSDSLTMRKILYKDGHSLLSQSLNNVGLAYIESGEFENGLEFSKQALAMRETKPIEKAETLNNMGLCYYKKGNLERALKYYLESIEIRYKKLPQNHPDIAKQLQQIGCCFFHLKDFQNALIYLKDALEMQKAQKNRNNSDMIEILDMIGLILYNQQDLSNALLYLKRALVLKKIVFKKSSIEVDSSYAFIGFIYYQLGDISYYKKYISGVSEFTLKKAEDQQDQYILIQN